MAISVGTLFTPLTKDQAVAAMVDMLTQLGFGATSWQSGSVQRTLLEVFAQMYANLGVTVSDIAKAGFNSTATGGWLDLIAQEVYGNERGAGRATIGAVTLTASASAPGPFTIDTGANQIVVATTAGTTYRNTTSGTLEASGTLTVLVQAEAVGSAGDVSSGAITVLKTPLAGVTVSNPDYTDPVLGDLGTWITVNGADAESDSRLRERNRTKWASLALAAPPADAYVHHALSADTSVTRAALDDNNPRGAGTLDLYVAGADGELSAATVSAVNSYLRGWTDGIDRVAVGANLLVQNASELAVIVTGSVYIESAFNTTAAQASVRDAVSVFFQGIPIGGRAATLGGTGVVVYSQLLTAVLTSAPGVRNVVFNSPTDNVEVPTGNVAVPTIILSFYSV